jgi:hypothetical protein
MTLQLRGRWQQRRSRLYMPPNITLPGLSFLESVEKGHAALDTNKPIAAGLGVRAPPVRMDPHAKYAVLVRVDAGAEVYLRLPIPGANYQENIWVRPVSATFFFWFLSTSQNSQQYLSSRYTDCCRIAHRDLYLFKRPEGSSQI